MVPSDSLAAGRLLASYGVELGRVEGNYEEASRAFDQARSIARNQGDDALELTTLAASADVDYFHLREEDSLSKSLECVDLAVRAGDAYVEARARSTAFRGLLQRGQSEAAEAHASALLPLGDRVQDRYWQVTGLHLNARLAHVRGDLATSRDLEERAWALTPGDPLSAATLSLVEYESGNFTQGEAYIESLLGIMQQAPPGPTSAYMTPAMVIPMVARITGVSYRLDIAREAAWVVLSPASAAPLYTVAARCGLALQSVIQKDAQGATEQYSVIEPMRGIFVSVVASSIDRILGLLSHTMGSLDAAAGHFEEAMAFCRRAGGRPELAWSCCDYADTLLQRNEPGDRERAMTLLEESLAISSELGMRPLMERVLSRREILKA